MWIFFERVTFSRANKIFENKDENTHENSINGHLASIFSIWQFAMKLTV